MKKGTLQEATPQNILGKTKKCEHIIAVLGLLGTNTTIILLYQAYANCLHTTIHLSSFAFVWLLDNMFKTNDVTCL